MRSDVLRVTGDRLAARIGGAPMLALPLLRALAMVALVVWLVLAPVEYRRASGLLPPSWIPPLLLAVEAALWWRPSATLRLNFYVLLSTSCSLTLIYLTGGARNSFYLALPLIAALQAYYYGLRRGVAVRRLRGGLRRPRLADDRNGRRPTSPPGSSCRWGRRSASGSWQRPGASAGEGGSRGRG
jgi:hypothetical protein